MLYVGIYFENEVAQILGQSFCCMKEHNFANSMAQILGKSFCCTQERPASRSNLNDQKGKHMHRKSAQQAAAAQATRKESPCTARAPGKPQQPKRPERKAHAPQERPASRSSPNDQKGKPMRCRSAQPTPVKKTYGFQTNRKKHVARMRPKISKKGIS